MSCVQMSKVGFRVVYTLGLWSHWQSSGVVKVLYGYG